jgi:hypothetical protein
MRGSPSGFVRRRRDSPAVFTMRGASSGFAGNPADAFANLTKRTANPEEVFLVFRILSPS